MEQQGSMLEAARWAGEAASRHQPALDRRAPHAFVLVFFDVAKPRH